jgi:hypothetical protein
MASLSSALHYPLQHPESSTGSTNDQSQSQPPPPQHKRVYQACIPCRRRKVKCDLGSVDSPGDPPCVRCRRESKECYFSATRRKRKAPDGAEGSADGYEFDDDYILRNGRKRGGHGSDDGSEPPSALRRHGSSNTIPTVGRSSIFRDERSPLPAAPLTPGGHIGRTQPLRRPNQSPEPLPHGDRNAEDANIRFENPEAQDVMRQEVYGPHDAFDLLYKAATTRYALSS